MMGAFGLNCCTFLCQLIVIIYRPIYLPPDFADPLYLVEVVKICRF